MSNQSTNTASRPSYAYPDCPTCETNVLVDGVKYANSEYYCHKCESNFRAPGAFVPAGHADGPVRDGERTDPPHTRDCPYCDAENVVLPYHLPCDGVDDAPEVFDL